MFRFPHILRTVPRNCFPPTPKGNAALVRPLRHVRHLIWCLAGVLPISNSWALIDTNVDGVSDVWMRTYGAQGLNPNADADGDGITNNAEAIAGTDPFDAQSGLNAVLVRRVDNGVILRWPAANNRSYRVETNTSLRADSWTAGAAHTIGGTGERIAIIERPVNPSAFFRVAAIEGIGSPPGWQLGTSSDSDRDGQNDSVEILAGTDPFNANSKFSVSEFSVGSGLVFEWPTVQGKSYQLQSNQAPSAEWQNEGPPRLASGPLLTASIEGASTATSFRVLASDVDSDSDGATDWEEWATGLGSTRSRSAAGDNSDVVAIRDLLATPVTYSVTARRPSTLVGGNLPGLVDIQRTAGFGPTKIPLTISGTALAGVDVAALSSVATIPPGETATTLTVTALPGAGAAKYVDIAIDGSSHASVNLVHENVISVKDFGALGNGTTDDTAAIQAAINQMELSSSHNTLHFPAGTYLLTSRIADNRTATGGARHLLLGSSDLAGRDIFVTGEPGAVLFSETGALRTHTLVVETSMRSLTFRGLTLAQGSTPRTAVPYGNSPNGADGVSLVMHRGSIVEGIEFNACGFSNCHGAVFAYGHGYDVRGSLKHLGFYGCQVLNPYGANTQNSGIAYGGGIQMGMTAWVGTATYDNNLFEGGGADMTDPATCPGGRVLDGCHFGSPMRLKFTNNVVKRMGVEAVFQTGGNTYMGVVLERFSMPPVDGSSLVSVKMDNMQSTFIPGDIVNVRTPGGPTTSGNNNLLYVSSFNSETRTLMLRNDGYASNAPPGTFVEADTQVYLNRKDEPTIAEIRNNLVEGKLPPGAHPDTEPAGIVVNTRSRISGNTLTDFSIGILIYDEVLTPLFPASRRTVIEHNHILTRNPHDATSITYGVQSWASDDVIIDNLVITPATYRFIGVTTRGKNARIENNTIISQSPANNGYGSNDRGVGIGFGNQSNNANARNNTTYGMDIGVGPESAHQSIPHRVSGHRSVNDVLGVDPRGILPD